MQSELERLRSDKDKLVKALRHFLHPNGGIQGVQDAREQAERVLREVGDV